MSEIITVSAILVILAGVQAQYRVTFYSQGACAVIGSTVKIPCRHTYGRLKLSEWYRVMNNNGDTVVLKDDPQYKERMSVGWYNCELTLHDIRLNDSGVYNFGYRTQSNSWTSASPGFDLNVTGLQVKVESNSEWRGVKVTCSSTCSLSNGNTYYRWYRDDVISDISTGLYSTYINSDGTYSCGVYGSIYRSPAACVLGKQCWGVTYTPEHVCALKSASAELSCSYKHPQAHTVTKSVWFIKEQDGVEPHDLKDDEEYQERVQYLKSYQKHCVVKINNVRESDAQTYRVRFYTDDPYGKYTGQPGVTLSVTDLKVEVSSYDNAHMQLDCSTTCSLSDNLIYIWYKNDDRVLQCKSASCSVPAVSGEVRYTCAVEGHGNFTAPPVYSPRNTTVVFFPSEEIVEGDSVSLSCSSDANPPVHTYSWFKQTVAADTLLIKDQNYNITNISSQHSGFYYCIAQNKLGQQNSTLIHLNVFYSEEISAVKHFIVGCFISLTLLLITGALWIWRKSRSAKNQWKAGQGGQTLNSRERSGSDDQNGILYANVHFKAVHTQDRNPSFTVQHPPDPTEEQEVQYAVVNFIKTSDATKNVTDDDPALIYSLISQT